MTTTQRPPGGNEGPGNATNHDQDNASDAQSRANYLIQNIRRAYELDYNIEPGHVFWDAAKGRKNITGLRRDWQRIGRLPLTEIERRVTSGEANGYLVHGSTSMPQAGGVTLLDGDTAEECARISAAVGDALPHVHSGSGWWHWYVRGVVKSSHELKTKDTAFGPGTWYLGPDGMVRQYAGALPAPDQLLTVVGAMPTPQAQSMAPVEPRSVVGGFFDPPASSALDLCKEKVAALGRRAQSAPEHRAAIRDAAFYAGGLIYLDAYTYENAHAALVTACSAIWGRADDDDLKWIEQGLNDGQRKRVPTRADTPGQAAGPTVAALGDSGAADGFDFAFLDPDVEPEPPEPARYGGFGGAPLFYDRGVHWLQGESESGKSMVAMAGPVLDAIRAGELVLYVDHEDTRARVQERLQQLGATREQIRCVCYVPATEVPHSAIVAHLTTSGREYAVMVVDGVTSALSAAGLSGRDEQEVTKWVDDLPRRARMSVCVDHVVKAQDNRAGMAIGSQAKKSVVTGTAYEVVCTEKFGRGTSGQIVLEIQKDKPGWVRGAGVKRVRLHVVSAPGTYALSIRIADGSVADPFDVWIRGQLDQGYRWHSQNQLHRDAQGAGQGYSKSRARERFERYEEVLREYESTTPNGAFWGGTHDHFGGAVPRTGSSSTGTDEKTLSPALTAVPEIKYHPSTTGTGTAVLPLVGSTGSTASTNGATNSPWPDWYSAS